jgi:hypothetical protein
VHQAPGIPHALSGRHYALGPYEALLGGKLFNDSGASRCEARTDVWMVAKRETAFCLKILVV